MFAPVRDEVIRHFIKFHKDDLRNLNSPAGIVRAMEIREDGFGSLCSMDDRRRYADITVQTSRVV